METSKLGDFFKKGIAAHIVREISQNTMDNKAGSDPAQLLFRFTKPSYSTALASYFEGLREHVEACNIAGANVDWSKPELLLIEDFGTKGLEGPVHDKKADGSFAKFWHRTGDSNKKLGSSKGGRHGVGKVVNAEASCVRAFFGYSVAASEGMHSTLLGRSYLKPHTLEESSADYHGLGTFHCGAEGDAVLPLTGEQADAFAVAVGFARKPKVPGLSLAVLWPKEDVGPESIRNAVLSECLYQLTAGQLSVTIGDKKIDASSVEEELRASDETRGLVPMQALVRAVCDAPSSAFIRPLSIIDPKGSNARITKESFDAKTLESMRANWLAGETVLLKVGVLLRPKGKPEITASFRLALKHVEPSEGGVLCVRDDVSVRGAVRWGKIGRAHV